MKYEILDSISRADIAFRVEGNNLEELFSAGARALVSIMLQNMEAIRPSVPVSFTCTSQEIDLLYFNFLSELIFYKDSEKLLLLPERITITSSSGCYTLVCNLQGDKIDRKRHLFNVDIKAVTLHNLIVETRGNGWSATAVVDV